MVLLHQPVWKVSGEGGGRYQHVQNKLFWRDRSGLAPNQQIPAMLANMIGVVVLCLFTLV